MHHPLPSFMQNHFFRFLSGKLQIPCLLPLDEISVGTRVIYHYPDFIIQTKSGKTILLETKGDHLDAEQKIKLGDLWKSKAGNNFRYFMVYERRTVDGACKLEDFLNIIRDI